MSAFSKMDLLDMLQEIEMRQNMITAQQDKIPVTDVSTHSKLNMQWAELQVEWDHVAAHLRKP